MSDFPASEFQLDGSPGAIQSSARQWLQFGQAATEAAVDIRSLDSTLFIGPEGDQYRQGLNDSLPPHLDVTGTAYTDVGNALSGFSGNLTGLQGRMSPLRGKAPGLWDALQQAKGRVSAAQTADAQHAAQAAHDALTRPPLQPAPPDTYHSDLGAASGALSAAQQAWDNNLAAARGVKQDLQTAVDRTTKAIHAAADTRFAHNPHGFGALVAGFENFVKDHASALAKISGVLKLVSGIAGVLSFIPVIGEAALAVSLITAGAALAIDASIKLSTGQGSWKSIAVDGALLVVPFGAGKMLEFARGARGAEDLADAATTVRDLGGNWRVPGGPGNWEQVTESMSARAAAYQEQVTGVPQGYGYVVNGVKLDGYDGLQLLDAKGQGYSWAVNDGEFRAGYHGAQGIVDQAQRQLRVAGGTPITWRVAEPDTAEAIKNILAQNNITGITVVHIPPR